MTAAESPESPETNGNGGARGASVIVNAIAVLRTLTAEEPLLGVTEIAHRVGLHQSTVSPERLETRGEACAAAAHRVTTRLGGRAPGSAGNHPHR